MYVCMSGGNYENKRINDKVNIYIYIHYHQISLYVNKGSDMATFAIVGEDGRYEIKNYPAGRFISSYEANRRIFFLNTPTISNSGELGRPFRKRQESILHLRYSS